MIVYDLIMKASKTENKSFSVFDVYYQLKFGELQNHLLSYSIDLHIHFIAWTLHFSI